MSRKRTTEVSREAHATSVALGIAARDVSANALARVTAVCVSSSHSATPSRRACFTSSVSASHTVSRPAASPARKVPGPAASAVHALDPAGLGSVAMRFPLSVTPSPPWNQSLIFAPSQETAAASLASTCRADCGPTPRNSARGRGARVALRAGNETETERVRREKTSCDDDDRAGGFRAA